MLVAAPSVLAIDGEGVRKPDRLLLWVSDDLAITSVSEHSVIANHEQLSRQKQAHAVARRAAMDIPQPKHVAYTQEGCRTPRLKRLPLSVVLADHNDLSLAGRNYLPGHSADT